MRKIRKKTVANDRGDAAAAALPDLHQKLKPISSNDLGAPDEQGLDLSRLTDEELEEFEQLVAKTKSS